VIAGIATVFRKFKKAFGPDTLGVTDVSGNRDHGGDIDAKRAIHGTTLAHGTLQP
jgi:hypothetical protein